jgi:hypothetical protein
MQKVKGRRRVAGGWGVALSHRNVSAILSDIAATSACSERPVEP